GSGSLGVGDTSVRLGKCYNVASVASESSGDDLRPLDLAPTGVNLASISRRGKVCSVQECTLGSLNVAQSPTHSTPNNVAPSSSLATQGLWFNARNETLLGGSICSEGPTVVEPGSWRGPSISLQPTLAIDDTRQTYSTATWDRSPTYLREDANPPTVSLRPNFSGCRYITQIANTRLLCSLCGQHPTSFVLVVAVDEAIYDLDILRLISGASKQGRIHFSGLGRDVSLDKIHAKITQLYDSAAKIPGSELIVFLTGHGDGANRMHLRGDEFVDEADLYQLFESLKLQNTHPTFVPVTIFFDICRESDKPSGEPPEGVTLIWSCSPGESAHAFRLPHDPKIPHSCFILALIMGSRLPDPACSSEMFKNSVKKELDQLTVYLQKVHSLRHSDGKCAMCLESDELCKEPRQSIDWRHAKASIWRNFAAYTNAHIF
ncbi:hypothetical protein FRC11_009116, partial [Ceratobasidium sp. 423]